MEKLKVCILGIFIVISIWVIDQGDVFWTFVYFVASGIVFATYRFIRWFIRRLKEPIRIYLYEGEPKKKK